MIKKTPNVALARMNDALIEARLVLAHQLPDAVKNKWSEVVTGIEATIKEANKINKKYEELRNA